MAVRICELKQRIRRLTERILCRLCGQKWAKYAAELRYWRKKAEGGGLRNAGYFDLFVMAFGLDKEFYRGKKILDIGCGPRGSLEWADMASERIGLDPLADSYRKLGADRHKMKYVTAYSEAIPFPDGYFDVVVSINSLDHVDDLVKTITEIIRVTAPGGYFLLIVEVNHPPTVCEPTTFSWDIKERFLKDMECVDERRYELYPGQMLRSVREARQYNPQDLTERSGLLLAKFRKRA